MFEPSFSVKKFAWPAECDKIESQSADRLAGLVAEIDSCRKNGHKIIGFVSSRPASGCTMLLLSAARRIKNQGIKTLIVDANYRKPEIAKKLNLAPEFGWEDTIDGKPLEEASIESETEPVCVIPIVSETSDEFLDATYLAQTVKSHFDVILVDMGDIQRRNISWLDCIVLIRDTRNSDSCPLDFDSVPVIGQVENFVKAA